MVLGNDKEAGARVTTGPVDAAPVPVKVSDCGLPLALSVIARKALRIPVTVGVKVTRTLQLPEATTLAPQVFVWAKSVLFAPLMEMLVMLRVALPVLVRVTD